MRIDYSRQGSGQPVLLIHGIGHRREAWGEVPTLLAQAYDVIAIDLPGFGRSPAPVAPDDYRLDSTLDQIERLLAELGAQQPHVAGNSLGGLLALKMAERGSVRSVTALAPAGFADRTGLAVAVLGLLAMRAGSYAPEPVLDRVGRSARVRSLAMNRLYVHGDRLSPEQFTGDTVNLRRSPGFWPTFTATTEVRRPRPTKIPTTIVWGAKDRLLLPSQAQEARRRLPDATHVILPKCGHVPMIDSPAAVVRAITDTIARA